MAWYYSVNGKAEGPVTQEFLIESLRAGRLTLVDLAFQEGAQAWRTLGEFPEFRDSYSTALPTPVAQAAEAPRPESTETPQLSRPSWEYAQAWVVLKEKDKIFEQDGPYTEKQIIEMIGTGDIQYSQYAWKPGYKRWVRIGNLPEFDRRKRDREGDSVNQIIPLPTPDAGFPVLTRNELLGAIERLQPKTLAPHETLPPEATGADLAEKFSAFEPTKISSIDATRISTMDATRIESIDATRISTFADAPVARELTEKAEKAEKTEKTAVTEPPPPSLRMSIVRALVATGAAFLIVVVLLQWYSKRKHPEVVESASSREESMKVPAAAPVHPVPVKKTVLPQASRVQASQPLPSQTTDAVVPTTPPARTATVVSIVPLRLSTSRPALAFQSDVPVGEAISVVIEGRTGDILEYPSYYSEHEVRRANGEIGTLDLANLRLPKGSYRIRAAAGAAVSEILVFVGVRDEEFEKARERHLKEIAFQQQTEKKAMYYGAQRLEALTRDLTENYRKMHRDPKAWNKYYAKWKSEAKEAAGPTTSLVSQARPNSLAFRTELLDFRGVTEKLGAYARQLDSSVRQKRDVAGLPETEVVREFSRVRQQAAHLTGR